MCSMYSPLPNDQLTETWEFNSPPVSVPITIDANDYLRTQDPLFDLYCHSPTPTTASNASVITHVDIKEIEKLLIIDDGAVDSAAGAVGDNKKQLTQELVEIVGGDDSDDDDDIVFIKKVKNTPKILGRSIEKKKSSGGGSSKKRLMNNEEFREWVIRCNRESYRRVLKLEFFSDLKWRGLSMFPVVLNYNERKDDMELRVVFEMIVDNLVIGDGGVKKRVKRLGKKKCLSKWYIEMAMDEMSSKVRQLVGRNKGNSVEQYKGVRMYLYKKVENGCGKIYCEFYE